MADESQRPIIVKRIKKGGHGHHGGAWKIAYADFVTAMMAFFLLMWLLGSVSQGTLDGIADFFKTPLKVALSGGSGSGDATSMIKGGGTDLTKKSGQVKKGETERQKEKERLSEVQKKLEQKINNNLR
jgi:chemotaxis protein MotB